MPIPRYERELDRQSADRRFARFYLTAVWDCGPDRPADRRRSGRSPACCTFTRCGRSAPCLPRSPICSPKTLENAKRQFVELYGSALVMNTYLKLALLLVSRARLGSAGPELPHPGEVRQRQAAGRPD